MEVAREVLDRRSGILEGARALETCLFRCGLEDDADLIIIRGVDSESDRFPLGKARENWDPKALAELDPEIKASGEYYRDVIEEACRRIVVRFGYPDDADGDALRRVALTADMSKPMDIDFAVAVPDEAWANDVARVVASRGYATKVVSEAGEWTAIARNAWSPHMTPS